jgi:hypothetical protein
MGQIWPSRGKKSFFFFFLFLITHFHFFLFFLNKSFSG